MKTKRQGDVQFIKAAAVPEGAKPKPGNTLFTGEATGHAHTMDAGELFETADGLLYLRTDKLTRVRHQEHKTVALEPGTYLVSKKRQFDIKRRWLPVGD